MLNGNRVGLTVALLCLVTCMSGPSVGAAASERAATPQGATRPDADRAAITRGATLSASAKHVDEGNRYTLAATIMSPRRALKLTLLKFKPSLYGWDDPAWEAQKTVGVKGRSKIKLSVVGVNENYERYRVVVTYMRAKPITSKPVSITVWRWIPMSDYDPYYDTGGTGFGTTTINGQVYTGWGAWSFSHTGVWESRFTPGRHCTAFRGVLGVGDISADGSSGIIAFTADDTDIYTSPTLTPGMAVPATVPLPTKPYRFGIRLTDTTPGGTTGNDEVESWPVIGEPAFHCTGV